MTLGVTVTTEVVAASVVALARETVGEATGDDGAAETAGAVELVGAAATLEAVLETAIEAAGVTVGWAAIVTVGWAANVTVGCTTTV